jgi:Spy/CpxP family protein refolding chaperone
MRKVLALCSLLSIIAIVSHEANAQRPMGGFGFGGGNLVTNKSVQEELKVTDEQKEKIKGVSEKQREAFGKLKDLSKEERTEKMKSMRDENKKEYASILNTEQNKRLKQIELQQDVVASLSTEDVIKELKLTDEQKEKLKAISDDLRKEQGELRKDRTNFKENIQKIQTLSKEATEKATKLLTADQQATWKQMTGEPFTVKFDFGGGNGKGRGKKKDD